MKNLLSIIAHLPLLLMNFVTSLLRPAGYGGQDWSKNHPAFFERERERGGKGKLFFP